MTFALVAHGENETTAALAAACPPELQALVVPPRQAMFLLRPGDLALGRLDVRRTLDGIEPGLNELYRLGARGVRVLNGPEVLAAAHDKLLTASALIDAGVSHPDTVLWTGGSALALEPPVVVKPRFGSWGLDVMRCDDAEELERCLRTAAERPWFRSHGAIVQRLIEPRGYDLRLIVANGAVVGAISRLAAPGEWRTNVALGGTRQALTPPDDVCELAVAAAAALGGDLVGVDILPVGDDGWTVLELNGDPDFTDDYSFRGDVFSRAMSALLAEAIEPEPVEPEAASL